MIVQLCCTVLQGFEKQLQKTSYELNSTQSTIAYDPSKKNKKGRQQA